MGYTKLTFDKTVIPVILDAIKAGEKDMDKYKKIVSINVHKEIRHSRSGFFQWFFMVFKFVPFNAKNGRIFDCLSVDPSALDFGRDETGKPNSEMAQTYYKTASLYLEKVHHIQDILSPWKNAIKYMQHLIKALEYGTVEIPFEEWKGILDLIDKARN